MSDTQADGWKDYGPGVKVKRLGGEDGAGFYLMRLDPGAVVPRHSHPQRETILVLEGELTVSTWSRPGSPYSMTYSDEASDFPPDEEHEFRAHPEQGALLLDVARPDWPAL